MVEFPHLHHQTVPHRRHDQGDSSDVDANDRFVLDSVDGLSSTEELAFLLGMSFEDVASALLRLAQSSLVEWEASEEPVPEGEVDTSPVPVLAPPKPPPTAGTPATSTGPSTVPVDVLAADGTPSSDYLELAKEIESQNPSYEATRDYSVGDLLHQMSNATTSVAAVTERRTRGVEPISSERPLPPPIPARSQDRIPTSNHPAVHPPGPTGPQSTPPSASNLTQARRSVSSATPRRHLDTSWWAGGSRPSPEPDEVLTAREVSVSGLIPTGEASPVTADESTDARPTLPQTPQRLERPPGGFLRARSITREISAEMGADEILQSHGMITAEVAAISADGAEASGHDPNGEDGAGETLQLVRPLADILEAVGPENWEILPDEIEPPDPWLEEPIRASLKETLGGWDAPRARCISWFVRIVQTGTYYDVLRIERDASVETVIQAARELRRRLDLGTLHQSADTAGLEALAIVDKGIERALDILSNADGRAAYNAALDALAAFKV